MSEKLSAVTKDDLKEIFGSLIEEVRKPVVTDRERRELEEMQQAREASVEQIKEQEEATKRLQTVYCKHRRRDNSPRTVHVNNHPKSGGEFLICQACQAVIRPDNGTPTMTDGVIYDTGLFNSLVVDQSPVIW